MRSKQFLSLKTLSITIILIAFIGTCVLIASAFTFSSTVDDHQAWELSRKIVAEIEDNKANSILAEQPFDMDEPDSLLQAERQIDVGVFEVEKELAIVRCGEIYASIADFDELSLERQLTAEEEIVLISLQDEALDLEHRYEIYRSISPEEQLHVIINTLRSEGDYLEYFFEILESARSPMQTQSVLHQIFLAESYVALAEDVQAQWDSGASVEYLHSYIDSQRRIILAKSDG